MNTLEQGEELENTVVIFVSDHGEGMGQAHWTQKQILYENPARVCCVISQKGKSFENIKDKKHLVSTGLDLFPTILDFAQINYNKDEMYGKSLKPLVMDDTIQKRSGDEWRTFVPAATEFGTGRHKATKEHKYPMGRMIRKNIYKYCVYSEGESKEELLNNSGNNKYEQLFNLEEDPYELKNLVNDNVHREILEDHRSLLIEWIRKTNDDFFTPTWLNKKSWLRNLKHLI